MGETHFVDEISWDSVKACFSEQARREVNDAQWGRAYNPGKYDTHHDLVNRYRIVYLLSYSQTYDSPELDIWMAALYISQDESKSPYSHEWTPFKKVKEVSKEHRFYHKDLIYDLIQNFRMSPEGTALLGPVK